MKQNNSPIVCMAFTAYRGNFAKSTTQLMSRLSTSHKVLYIDYQYTIKDVFDALLGKKKIEWKRILGLAPRIEAVKTEFNSTIYVLSLPPVFPVNWINNYNRFKKGLALNTRIIGRAINKAIKKMEIEDPTVINAYNPFYGLNSRTLFQNTPIIYYCYDEINGSPWAQKHGAKIEKEFIENTADLVITSSQSLQKTKGQFHSKVELIENGVDFHMFHEVYKASENGKDEPKPVIGYIGSLDERLDYELIKYAALKRPQYQFRFIGRVVFPEMVQSLRDVPNIELADPIAYPELPYALQRFSIGLIPFLKTEFTKNIYPLKINEYLAMGKAVVKTDFADLPEFDEIVWTSSSKKDFLDKIDEALTPISQDILKQRIEIASRNSWDNRVQKLSKLIADSN